MLRVTLKNTSYHFTNEIKGLFEDIREDLQANLDLDIQPVIYEGQPENWTQDVSFNVWNDEQIDINPAYLEIKEPEIFSDYIWCETDNKEHCNFTDIIITLH